MFKRRFKENFDFIEDSFFGEKAVTEFDRIIYVINNQNELLNFLARENKGTRILVCLSNMQFYRSLAFMESENNLVLIDESKTRNEILKKLNAFFSNHNGPETKRESFSPYKISQKKMQEYYRAIYFLM